MFHSPGGASIANHFVGHHALPYFPSDDVHITTLPDTLAQGNSTTPVDDTKGSCVGTICNHVFVFFAVVAVVVVHCLHYPADNVLGL